MTTANIVLSAKDTTRAAFASLDASLRGASQRLDALNGTVQGFLGLGAVAGFTAGLTSAINELDRLGDTAPKIGLTTQSLAELGFAAKLSGTDTATLESAIGKLSTRMADAAGGSKETAAMFATLGIKVKDAAGNLKSGDTVLGEIADKFSTFTDGPERAALAVEIFGKSGRELIPLLIQGSKGIEGLRAEFRALNGGDIEAAAQAAGLFNDNLVRLQANTDKFSRQVIEATLPVLNDLVTGLIGTKKATGDVNVVAEALATVLETVTVAGANVSFVIKQVGNEIGGLAAQAVALATLNIDGFFSIGEKMRDDAKSAREAVDQYSTGVLRARELAVALSGIDKSYQALENRRLAAGSSGQTNTAPVIAKVGAETQSAYKAISDELQKQIALAAEQERLGRQLLDSEKFRIDINQKINGEKVKLTAAERASLSAQAEFAIAQKESAERRAQQTKLAQQAYAAELDFQEEIAIAEREAAAARESARTYVRDIVLATEEQTRLLELEASLVNATEQQRGFALEKLRIELQLRKDILEVQRRLQFDAVAQQDAIERLNADAQAKIANAQKRSILDEFNRTTAQISDSLTDALLRGFESGKSFVRNFVDTVKNLFKTLVLTPTIKAIIQPVAGALTGALGISGPANAATGGGGIGNLLSLGSNLSTAYSALTGSFINSIGSAATAAGNLFGSTAAAEFGLGIQGFQTFAALEGGVTGALGAGASTGSALSSAAAAGPYVLAAVAALNALGVFRSRKIVDGGLQGELGGQVNDFALERRGGTLFNGPSYRVLDRGVSAQNDELQKAYSAIRDTVAGMAEQLGIGNEAIKAFTVQLGSDLIHPDTGGFGIKTQGLSQDEIVKKIEAALVSANEQLAAFALGTTQYSREGETAVQTLARLNQSLTGVNGVFDNLGLSLIDVGLAGADTASKFVELFGGMEEFAAASNSYYQNFFSETERTANTVQALTAEFAALGLELPTSREGFRDLVEAQRALGEAALPTVARIIQLNETFASVVPPTEALTAAASELAATVTETVQSFQTALVSLGPNPFTPTVDGFQSLLAQMNADIAAANAQIAGTVSNSYQSAIDAIQQRAADLRAQLEPGYAADLQNQLDQATYGRSLAEANLRYLQNVGDEVNAVFQQERIAAFTAEIQRLTGAMAAGPDVQAFINSQIALLNFQNGQRAADLVGGLNEAVADLGRTDAERRIAAIGKQYDDYIKQLTDLNQLTPANIAAVEAWKAAMLAAANTGADAAGTLTDATNQLAQAQAGVQNSLQSLFDYGQRITQQIDALRRQAAADLLQARGGVTGALDNLRAASESASQRVEDAMRSVADSVGNYLRELAGSSAGSANIFQQRDFNGSQFNDLAALALAGDTTAGAQVTDAAQAYIDSLRATSTSTLDFAREELRIRAQLAQISDLNTLAPDGSPQEQAAKASQDYAEAVAAAAAAGVEYTAAVKTSTSDFNEALAAFIDAQRVAQAVQADLASADATLVQQYAGLTADLQDFQSRTAGLLDGFTGKVDTLGDLLSQYAEAVAKLNGLQTPTAGAGGGGAAPTQGGSVNGSILDQLRNDPAFRAESIRIAAAGANSTKGELVRALEAAGFTPEQIAVNVSNVLGESVTPADVATLRGFANGGVFTNGIVSQPTLFNMAQMGEGGRSEAIVPLAQGPQGLGIRNYGGVSGADTSRMESQMERLISRIGSLETELRDIKSNTGDTKTILRKVTQDGDAITTVAA